MDTDDEVWRDLEDRAWKLKFIAFVVGFPKQKIRVCLRVHPWLIYPAYIRFRVSPRQVPGRRNPS